MKKLIVNYESELPSDMTVVEVAVARGAFIVLLKATVSLFEGRLISELLQFWKTAMTMEAIASLELMSDPFFYEHAVKFRRFFENKEQEASQREKDPPA